MSHSEIRGKIAAYGLFTVLSERLDIIVKGGVANSTIRKAFTHGPVTPRLSLILDIAKAIIIQHEEEIKHALPTSTGL